MRALGALALVLATAQVLLSWWWNGKPLLDSLLSGIALAMALLPEEIPVILTVFLALGAWRIARLQVLTRRITAVETLGAIDVDVYKRQGPAHRACGRWPPSAHHDAGALAGAAGCTPCLCAGCHLWRRSGTCPCRAGTGSHRAPVRHRRACLLYTSRCV